MVECHTIPFASTYINAEQCFQSPADQDFERDALRAGYRLVSNHEAVVKFALRGPGQPGPRPVAAALADPSAIPALEHLEEVDAGERGG